MASPATSTAPPETIIVESTSVACDGGGALGHPRVYLTMADGDSVECPYCDRKYVLKPGSPRGGH